MSYTAEQVQTSGGLALTGSAASVTQATSRTTGVTINSLCGNIVTDDAALSPETAATFTVTNNTVAIGDVVIVCIRSGADLATTAVQVAAVANGSFDLSVINNTVAAGTDEEGAIVINFAVIKAI